MLESLLTIGVLIVLIIVIALAALAVTAKHAVDLITQGDVVKGIIGLVILATILKVLIF